MLIQILSKEFLVLEEALQALVQKVAKTFLKVTSQVQPVNANNPYQTPRETYHIATHAENRNLRITDIREQEYALDSTLSSDRKEEHKLYLKSGSQTYIFIPTVDSSSPQAAWINPASTQKIITLLSKAGYFTLNKLTSTQFPTSKISTDELIIFPERHPLINDLIREAKSEILISRQAPPNIGFCQCLKEAKERGVKVKILLTDPDYFAAKSLEDLYKENPNIHPDILAYSKEKFPSTKDDIEYLKAIGIDHRFIDHKRFILNHSKFMIIDSRKVYIGSAPNDEKDRIDVGVVSENSTYVEFLTKLFYADYDRTELLATPHAEIALAPINMRQKIVHLLSQAQISIRMMFPVITDDPEIMRIVKQKLAQNITVEILCEPTLFSGQVKKAIDEEDEKFNRELISSGAILKTHRPSIHNRSILIDAEDLNKSQSYIGSGHLRISSMDNSREVGLITPQKHLNEKLFQLFNRLWAESKIYSL